MKTLKNKCFPKLRKYCSMEIYCLTYSIIGLFLIIFALSGLFCFLAISPVMWDLSFPTRIEPVNLCPQWWRKLL